MKIIWLSLLICLTTQTKSSNGSKVLILMPVGSESHKNILRPLVEELSKNDHEVTMVSLYGSRSEEQLPYKDVGLTKTLQMMKEITGEFNIFKMLEEDNGKNINSEVAKKVVRNLPSFCSSFLSDPEAEAVLEEKPDLIILTALMNECGLILVKKFNVPFIYVTTSGLTPWTADLVGNPENPAFVPNQYLPFSNDMTLMERMANSLVRIASPILRSYFILRPMDKIAQSYLNDPTVSLADVESEVSMVFVNSHHSLSFPRPLLPNVIEVGGMHCREPRSLANSHPEIYEFLETSTVGQVILFSLGSVIKSTDMPPHYLNIFIKAFARLRQYKIIWKWEGERPENLTTNVLISNWTPQQDILGHPSVGAFFTHGGLLSMQEAVYHGVPLIGIPIMSDQHLNVKQMEVLGIGTGLDLYSLTEHQIVSSIKLVMEDPSYRNTIQLKSNVMRDQHTTPLERGVYWTEYVIRHGGAAHLKSNSAKMSFFKYFCLDVILLTILVCLTAIIVLSYVIAKVSHLRRRLSRAKESTSNIQL